MVGFEFTTLAIVSIAFGIAGFGCRMSLEESSMLSFTILSGSIAALVVAQLILDDVVAEAFFALACIWGGMVGHYWPELAQGFGIGSC